MAEEAKKVLIDEDRRYECDIQRRLLNDARATGGSKNAARNDDGVEMEGNENGADDTWSSNSMTTTTRNLLHLRDRLFEVLNNTENELERREEKID